MKSLFHLIVIGSLLSLFAANTTMGQSPQYRYLILFKDKKGSEYSTSQPQAFLSARALARRDKMQIKISEQDLPVNPSYISQLKTRGAQVLYPLKWINGAVIKTDLATLHTLLRMPSVSGYYKNMALDSLPSQLTNNLNRTLSTTAQPDYGTSSTQIKQLGVDVMHETGFKAKIF